MPKTLESIWNQGIHFFSLRPLTVFAETTQPNKQASNPKNLVQNSSFGVFKAAIIGVASVAPWVGISCYGYVAGQIATLEGSLSYLPRVSLSILRKNILNHAIFRGSRQACREPAKTGIEKYMKEHQYGAGLTALAEAGGTSLADVVVYPVETSRIIMHDISAASYRYM